MLIERYAAFGGVGESGRKNKLRAKFRKERKDGAVIIVKTGETGLEKREGREFNALFLD